MADVREGTRRVRFYPTFQSAEEKSSHVGTFSLGVVFGVPISLFNSHRVQLSKGTFPPMFQSADEQLFFAYYVEFPP